MARHVWSISFFSCYQRMVSITTSCGFLLCIPQQGFCHEKRDSFKSKEFVNEVLTQASENNTDDLLASFDNLDKSKDPLADGKKFLNSFLKELNSRCELNLTIHEACQLIRKNLHTLDLPTTMQHVVLNAVELYESNNPTNLQHQKLKNSLMIAAGISWPWEWNWFGLNSKHSTNDIRQNKNPFNPTILPPKCATDELPSDVYIGAVELLAGALCYIAGIAYPPLKAPAYYLLGDGTRRVIGGTVQLGEERRNDPNYTQPDFPYSDY